MTTDLVSASAVAGEVGEGREPFLVADDEEEYGEWGSPLGGARWGK